MLFQQGFPGLGCPDSHSPGRTLPLGLFFDELLALHLQKVRGSCTWLILAVFKVFNSLELPWHCYLSKICLILGLNSRLGRKNALFLTFHVVSSSSSRVAPVSQNQGCTKLFIHHAPLTTTRQRNSPHALYVLSFEFQRFVFKTFNWNNAKTNNKQS